jgi:hypothetical protein
LSTWSCHLLIHYEIYNPLCLQLGVVIEYDIHSFLSMGNIGRGEKL